MLIIEHLWPFSAGAVIGAVYFASLRWTVARLVRARQPMIWLLGSATLRGALVRPLFYIVGFVAGRILSPRGRRDALPAARTAG